MNLLEKLIDEREELLDEIAGVAAKIEAAEGQRLELEAALSDLDKAIAALRTPEVETDTVQDRVEALLDQGLSLPDQSSSQEIPEGFTKWEGGECPVEEGHQVEIITEVRGYRNQYTPDNTLTKHWRWSHDEGAANIIAYRIIEAQPDPADLPPPTEAEFNALEKLDGEIKADPINELPQYETTVVQGEHVVVGHFDMDKASGDGEQIEDHRQVQTATEQSEPFEAHKHGGEAGFWASRLFGKPKVDA